MNVCIEGEDFQVKLENNMFKLENNMFKLENIMFQLAWEPRVVMVSPAVYPRFVVNFDFMIFFL